MEVYIAVNLCSDCICSLGYEVPGHRPPDINCRCYCPQRSQIPAVSPYSPLCPVCLHGSSLRSSLIDRERNGEEDRGVRVREEGSITPELSPSKKTSTRSSAPSLSRARISALSLRVSLRLTGRARLLKFVRFGVARPTHSEIFLLIF